MTAAWLQDVVSFHKQDYPVLLMVVVKELDRVIVINRVASVYYAETACFAKPSKVHNTDSHSKNGKKGAIEYVR